MNYNVLVSILKYSFISIFTRMYIVILMQKICSYIRCYVSVALLNGIIFAMGGFDGHQRLLSAEKYNFERNQWTMVASMNSQRSDACAAVLNS